MRTKYIKGLYKQPLLKPKEWTIKDEYKEYQFLVNGHIEVVPFPGIEDVAIILNEEGKIYGMTPNVECKEYDDVFVGPIIVVGEEGDGFRSLTAKEMEKALHYLTENDYSKYDIVYDQTIEEEANEREL